MKTRLLLVALMSVLLSGCIPAAFVAGATAGGAIIYDNRPLKTLAQDNELEFQAQRRINMDPQLRGQAHISVYVFNHIVLLVGQAPTTDLSQHAYNIVSAFPNIKRIYNEIAITQPVSGWKRSQDAWITTKVKAAMLAHAGLRSTQIKVATENGTVYLMGYVSHTQGNIAADVASKVDGVQTVVKLFEYPN